MEVVDLRLALEHQVASKKIPPVILQVFEAFCGSVSPKSMIVVQTNVKPGVHQGCPKERFNFQSFNVAALVYVKLDPDCPYQDLFHICSPLYPGSWKCGIEVGLRNGFWAIGMNFGLDWGGYKEEQCFQTPATEGEHRVAFHKCGSKITVNVDGEVFSWDLEQQDLDSAWLQNNMVVGARNDRSDGILDFRWCGQIMFFSSTLV